eukprot:TRINITY_DN3447_c0_g1_i2.p1 TRINITY_DN3447_c0_g1~~TRINITY_DN3447_c0_g1_i2.p1  ORF type:complete len:142 (-),score=29.35 TRINITY_DN3447_c0_g1_i2:40-465(-)
MWSENKKWIWYEVNTYCKFLKEANSLEHEIFSKHKSQARLEIGAESVLNAVPANARKIFCLFVETILERDQRSIRQREFCELAAKKFFTTSLQTMKVLMSEFISHGLINEKEEKIGGTSIYTTTLDDTVLAALLKKFKDEN